MVIVTLLYSADGLKNIYHRVMSSIVHYLFKKKLFAKKSLYMRIKTPLLKQSEKTCMCF